MPPSLKDCALGEPQWRQLSAAVERLYALVPVQQFSGLVFEVVTSLIPEVDMSFEDMDPQSGTHLADFNFQPKDEADFRASLAVNLPRDHPGVRLVAQGKHLPFSRLSDLISMRQLKQTGMYADQFKPRHWRYQFGLFLEKPGHIVGMSINRGIDFSAHDEHLVRMLAPHLSRAYANARLFTTLQARAAQTPSFEPEALCRRGITPREAEVLQWMVEGKRNSEIAIILAISERTVEKHCERLLAKLGVETRTAAAARALEILAEHGHRPIV